jgi:hypothetical protein
VLKIASLIGKGKKENSALQNNYSGNHCGFLDIEKSTDLDVFPETEKYGSVSEVSNLDQSPDTGKMYLDQLPEN